MQRMMIVGQPGSGKALCHVSLVSARACRWFISTVSPATRVERQTDGKIRDQATERVVEVFGNREPLQSHTQAVDEH